MNDIAIRVESLSKRYRIGVARRHNTLRDRLAYGLAAPFRHLRSGVTGRQSGKGDPGASIWALKEVSFEVKRGEVVGVIGRNGAGKSTLLKILSRITEPTEGRAEVYGRVSSLLDVGTGFHPELSGRENVYLNAAILGMTRREMVRRFDEIVQFAEVEQFLDTPVKHYSSGMYMRLAFSVAAHLDPEILVVDEVLAVGDAEFQRKCLGKMGEAARGGRTVIFVSHNIPSLLNLCSVGLLLEAGRVRMEGDIRRVTGSYLKSATTLTGWADLSLRPQRAAVRGLRFSAVRVLEPGGTVTPVVDATAGFELEIEYEVAVPIRNCQIVFSLVDPHGHCVFQSTDLDADVSQFEATRESGRYVARCFVPPTYLRSGTYTIDLSSSVPGVRMLDEYPGAIAFDVVDGGSVESRLAQGRKGVIAPVLPWQTSRKVEASAHSEESRPGDP